MQSTILLAAGDVGSATDFYDRIGLRLDRSPRRPGLPSTYVVAKLQMRPATDVPPPLRGRLIMLVDDMDAALACVSEAGGTVLTGPGEAGGARVALVADPDGNEFGLTDTPR